MIGAWWEELEARGLFAASKPEVSSLDKQLFADGLRHEQVLLSKLESQGNGTYQRCCPLEVPALNTLPQLTAFCFSWATS